MQGHIHKRVRTDRHGKETVRWYVVIDRRVRPRGTAATEVARRVPDPP